MALVALVALLTPGDSTRFSGYQPLRHDLRTDHVYPFIPVACVLAQPGNVVT